MEKTIFALLETELIKNEEINKNLNKTKEFENKSKQKKVYQGKKSDLFS